MSRQAHAWALRFIDPDDPAYEAERELRYQVLRRPLGDPRGSEAFPFEAQSLHLVATIGPEVVGCVLFHPDGRGGGRLFQMAVRADLQGTGVGRALVQALQARLKEEGLREITLHAREHAVGFYQRLGYACFGAPYLEVGIPHRHMRKDLTA